jgi:hypothetical protein
MTPAELLALIASDPQATAFFQSGNDEACATRCTAIASPVRQPVPASKLRVALAVQGNLANILRMAANVNSPEPPYGTCLTLMTLLDAGDPIDLDQPAVQRQAEVLMQHGLLTAEHRLEIAALANTPQIITFHDVGAARQQAGVTANGIA